eukprot:g8246.t1
MATLKTPLPRSTLSESLREYENNASRRDTEITVSPFKTTQRNTFASTETWDAMTELDSILHSTNNNNNNNSFNNTVVLVGTPPKRPTNPIPRDRNFTRKTKTMNHHHHHHSYGAFKNSVCKETWSSMGASTCDTFH